MGALCRSPDPSLWATRNTPGPENFPDVGYGGRLPLSLSPWHFYTGRNNLESQQGEGTVRSMPSTLPPLHPAARRRNRRGWENGSAAVPRQDLSSPNLRRRGIPSASQKASGARLRHQPRPPALGHGRPQGWRMERGTRLARLHNRAALLRRNLGWFTDLVSLQILLGYVVELTPAVIYPGDAPSPSAALSVSNIRR